MLGAINNFRQIATEALQFGHDGRFIYTFNALLCGLNGVRLFVPYWRSQAQMAAQSEVPARATCYKLLCILNKVTC